MAYTHTFNFKVGASGEKYLTGELQVNETDNTLEYKISTSSDPFPSATLRYFMAFMDLINKIYTDTGGINDIDVTIVAE